MRSRTIFSGDIEIEREALHDSVAHDYSTSATGLVPLDRRRPIGHFIALWTTFAAGFSFLFVGTEVYQSGFTLPGTIGVTLLGIGIYFAYGIFAAYLGSRTGQTMSLLTRSIFGRHAAPTSCRRSLSSARWAGSGSRAV